MSQASEQVKDFFERLADLQSRKEDQLRLEDIAALLTSYGKGQNQAIQECLARITGAIDSARHSVVKADAGKLAGEIIPDANLELDAVVKATEEATNKILDEAEAIQNALAGAPESLAQIISEHITRIFESCNFQDITGQRISKVVNTLLEIEEIATTLQGVLDGSIDPSEISKRTVRDIRPDAHLMEGPQLDENLPSQDEIDRMFGEA
ncbi:MAG: hypothetical protein H6908_03285 [Hyphomicrobiales bacterium]|nr:hypothetical protein [Hyphomicrobiales bacterium]